MNNIHILGHNFKIKLEEIMEIFLIPQISDCKRSIVADKLKNKIRY